MAHSIVHLHTKLVDRATKYTGRRDWLSDLGRVAETCIQQEVDLAKYLPDGWPGPFGEELATPETQPVNVPSLTYENIKFLAGLLGCSIKATSNTLLMAYVHSRMLGKLPVLLNER